MRKRVQGSIAGFLLVCAFFSGASANNADAFFVKGNEYYQEGQYQRAIAEYEKILIQGLESWEVYYNIGNAYYKLGNIGRAILNYERAKRLNPENEDIRFNLEFANMATADRIEKLPAFFLTHWIAKVGDSLGVRALGYATVSIYLVAIAIVIARVLRPSLRRNRVVFTGLVVSATALCLVAGLFASRIVAIETIEEAIVLVDKADVRSAPGETGTEVFTLHEGVKVEIRDHSMDWVKIRLADGKVGWISNNAIEKI